MSRFSKSGKLPKSVAGVVLLVIVTILRACDVELRSLGGDSARPEATPNTREPSAQSGAARIERAFEAREHEVPVELTAIVEKALSDDDVAPRHQRFLVEISSGRTLLVAHNIDLAERVPVKRGDEVRLAGLYEWNDQGGVLHWTHRDPQCRHPGGFIELAGKQYR